MCVNVLLKSCLLTLLQLPVGAGLWFLLMFNLNPVNSPPHPSPAVKPLFTVTHGDGRYGNIPLHFIPSPVTWATHKSETKAYREDKKPGERQAFLPKLQTKNLEGFWRIFFIFPPHVVPVSVRFSLLSSPSRWWRRTWWRARPGRLCCGPAGPPAGPALPAEPGSPPGRTWRRTWPRLLTEETKRSVLDGQHQGWNDSFN